MPRKEEMGAYMRRNNLHYPVFYDVDHVGLLIRAQHILIQLQTCSQCPRLLNSMLASCQVQTKGRSSHTTSISQRRPTQIHCKDQNTAQHASCIWASYQAITSIHSRWTLQCTNAATYGAKRRLEDLSSKLTLYNIDCAHALDTLPRFKLMLLGALPPDAVRCIIASNPEVGAQLYPLYVHSGGLWRLHCRRQR